MHSLAWQELMAMFICASEYSFSFVNGFCFSCVFFFFNNVFHIFSHVLIREKVCFVVFFLTYLTFSSISFSGFYWDLYSITLNTRVFIIWLAAPLGNMRCSDWRKIVQSCLSNFVIFGKWRQLSWKLSS